MKMKVVIIILATLTLNTKVFAQRYSYPDRQKYLNRILADTGIGFGYYLMLNVRSEDSKVVKLLWIENQILFYYFKGKYGWNGKKYIQFIKPYVVTNKVLVLNDKKVFDVAKFPSANKCPNYANLSEDSLVHLFMIEAENSERAICIYKAMFNKNIEEAGLTEVVELIKDYSYNVQWEKPISLLFIDGLHDYPNVARDFWHFDKWVSLKGYIAFHDYSDYYPGVRTFVDELLITGNYRKINTADSLVVLQKV